MRDTRPASRAIQRTFATKRFIIIGKRAFRLAFVMTLVTLATFGALVETYKLLF